MYFNVIRNLIKENIRCIFQNGSMIIYDGYSLPADLNDLFIVEISATRDTLIFECC